MVIRFAFDTSCFDWFPSWFISDSTSFSQNSEYFENKPQNLNLTSLSNVNPDFVVHRRKDFVDNRSAPAGTRRNTFFIVNEEEDDDIIDGNATLARTRSASKSFLPINESDDLDEDDDDDDDDDDDGRSSVSSAISKKPSLTLSEEFDEVGDEEVVALRRNLQPLQHPPPPVSSAAVPAGHTAPPPPPLTLCIPARGAATNVEDLVMISPPSRPRLPRGGGRRGRAENAANSASGGVFGDVIPSPISSVTSSRDTSPTRTGPLSSSEYFRGGFGVISTITLSVTVAVPPLHKL